MSATVLLLGGCLKHKEQGTLNSVEIVEIEERSGQIRLSTNIIAELIEARRSPAVFFNKDRLIVVGGCNNEHSHSCSAEILIRDRGEWTVSTLIRHFCAEKSCSAYCEIASNLGVVVGGWNGADCLRNVQLVYMNSEIKSEESLPDISFPLKNSFAMALYRESRSLLLFGGWDNKQTLKTVFRLTFDTLFSSHEMVMEAILPYPVEGHACALLGDTIFIVGGYDGVSVLDSIIQYSISEKKSQVISTKLHIARENHACEIVLHKYLLVMAGWNGYESLDSIEIFQIVDKDPFLIKLPCEFKLCKARNRPVSVHI